MSKLFFKRLDQPNLFILKLNEWTPDYSEKTRAYSQFLPNRRRRISYLQLYIRVLNGLKAVNHEIFYFERLFVDFYIFHRSANNNSRIIFLKGFREDKNIRWKQWVYYLSFRLCQIRNTLCLGRKHLISRHSNVLVFVFHTEVWYRVHIMQAKHNSLEYRFKNPQELLKQKELSLRVSNPDDLKVEIKTNKFTTKQQQILQSRE